MLKHAWKVELHCTPVLDFAVSAATRLNSHPRSRSGLAIVPAVHLSAQELLRVGMHPNNVSKFLAPDNTRVLLAHHGRVRLGVLPVQILMTGRTYNLQRLHQVILGTPVLRPHVTQLLVHHRQVRLRVLRM